MTISSATLGSNLTVNEVLANIPFADSSSKNKEVVHNGLNESITLTGSSTPPASMVSDFQKALSTGAATIDLTALPGVQGAQDGSTLKVRMVKFRNPAANANGITITFGASNPYLLLGTGFKIILLPGQSTGPIYLKDGAPTIDSSHKTIDLAGTGSQALDCLFVLG